MSNVIQLLERLGQDAEARCSAEATLNRIATATQVSADIVSALKSGDQSRLSSLLGTRSNMYCQVFPAKQDDDEKQQDDDDKESPDDDTAKGFRNDLRRVPIAA